MYLMQWSTRARARSSHYAFLLMRPMGTHGYVSLSVYGKNEHNTSSARNIKWSNLTWFCQCVRPNLISGPLSETLSSSSIQGGWLTTNVQRERVILEGSLFGLSDIHKKERILCSFISGSWLISTFHEMRHNLCESAGLGYTSSKRSSEAKKYLVGIQQCLRTVALSPCDDALLDILTIFVWNLG